MKKVVVIIFFLSFIWVALGKGTMVFAQLSTAGQVIEYESLDSLVVKVNDGFGGAKIMEHTYNETTRKGTMRFDKPVEVLADSVFHECDYLISMTLPVQLKRIGDYAFFSCESLKSITIPNSLTSIGEGSFYFCGKLTSITIPKNVTHIGGGAFFRCNAMANFTVAADNPKYDSRQNCNALIETATNKLLYGFASSVIPESVTQIGDSAFISIRQSGLSIFRIASQALAMMLFIIVGLCLLLTFLIVLLTSVLMPSDFVTLLKQLL